MGPRLPEWLRKPQTAFVALHEIKRNLRTLGLETVCESARCPNIHECFARGTATFLILGNRCTRRCGFCAVPKAQQERLPPPDADEPLMVARMAAEMRLRHVVVTSVTRDDLPDGGAGHFAGVISALRAALPDARIEVLTPDFHGDPQALARVLEAGPHIFNHNLETVRRLYPRVRPQAGYERSLEVLAFAARYRPELLTKSGFMVGLGERPEEVRQLLYDLRQAGVQIVTVGQYLQPTRRNLAVAEYVSPAQFEAYRELGLALGFRTVLSGPFVRSSYLAEELARQCVGLGEKRP